MSSFKLEEKKHPKYTFKVFILR